MRETLHGMFDGNNDGDGVMERVVTDKPTAGEECNQWKVVLKIESIECCNQHEMVWGKKMFDKSLFRCIVNISSFSRKISQRS